MTEDKKEPVRRISQAELLRLIKLNEPVSGPWLAYRLKKSRQAIYLRLRKLERQGFIERIIPDLNTPLVPALYRCSSRLKEAERRLAGREADQRPSERSNAPGSVKTAEEYFNDPHY
jgi:DNA-binding Lrp family transcriptional regulator